MVNSNTLIENRDIYIRKAKYDELPANVPCPARCAFCLEHRFSRMFPHIRTRYISPYSDRTFNFYLEKIKALKSRKESFHNLCFAKEGSSLQYFTNCDFFSLGLTTGQIETLLRLKKKAGRKLLIYTTGLNADPCFLKYLYARYSSSLYVHLSLITFDPAIRKDLMNPAIHVDHLEKICKVLIKPTYFLLYFNKNQIISDIKSLNTYVVKNEGLFYIHKLYYNKISPQCVVDYAVTGEREFENIIFYLKVNDAKLKNISRRLTFSPSSRIYAWRFGEDIKRLLRDCKDRDDEAIFCSGGAYPVIRNLFRKAHVHAVKNAFGGCMDFALGMTIESILPQIEEIQKKGVLLRHIYIPSAMFCIESTFDLNGDRADLIRKKYPRIKVHIIKIHQRILGATLTLDTCVRYYADRMKAFPFM